ncbi:MAG: response regulator [Planctomycetota bacterium]
MNKKILLVDDDLPLIQSLERNLTFEYDVQIAEGGKQAIEMAERDGPFAVAVVDMRMPQMDGIQTIQALRARMKHCVFVMLTGNQDMDTVITAINKGQVFRFLNKPCEVTDLKSVVDDSLRQNQLLTVERDLLHNTFLGAVNLLSDLIEQQGCRLIDTQRLAQSMASIANELSFNISWEQRVAARVCLAGIAMLSASEANQFESLDPEEERHVELLARVCRHSAKMIKRIPRMDVVSDILKQIPESKGLYRDDRRDEITASLLKMSYYWNLLTMRGFSADEATHKLERLMPEMGERTFEALSVLNDNQDSHTVMKIPLEYLAAGMILSTNVLDASGNVIVSRGRPLTESIIENLQQQQHTELEEVAVISNSCPEMLAG